MDAGEKHRLVASRTRPNQTGTKPANPGMCPEWKSNPQPFRLQDDAQSTEPHQSGRSRVTFYLK